MQAATPLVWKDEIFLTVSYSTGAALLRAKGANSRKSGRTTRRCRASTTRRFAWAITSTASHGRSDVGTAELRCVEWKTGTVKWSEQKFGVASVIAVDGGLLALTEAGDLVRFDASPDGYKERGRAQRCSTKPTRAAPALADGRLFARDGKKLVCVKLREGWVEGADTSDEPSSRLTSAAWSRCRGG